ncbi:MAG: Mini-ribonuclease 3 [Lachnospiraceae bacterium]
MLCETFALKKQDMKTYSPLTLAYIGDAVYEIIIRTILVEQGNAPVNVLHKHASKLVKAEAQKDAYHRIKELLTEEEQAVFRRGRNAKSYTSAKNATIGDYRTATGFEALFGYWYLTGQTSRMLGMAKAGLTEGKEEACDTRN